MAQTPNGSMVGLDEEQFNKFMAGGATNIVRGGDVFAVRGCYFRVATIGDYGISARGISRSEYLTRKAARPLSERLNEISKE